MSNFRFWVVDIYGPAQHEHSENFILELSNCCVVETLPIVLGVISTSLGAIMIGTKVKVIRD
jgi:hypothetical protein